MASITPKNGRVAFVAAHDPDIYYVLDSTDLGTNYGDDSGGGTNTNVGAGDIGTAESYDGMDTASAPPTGTDLDSHLINDACALVYIPAGLAHGTVYGLFHNGGGTNGQGGMLRATTTGVEIACSHNNGNSTSQDTLIEEIPDADLPGWFCFGFQFNSNGGTEGDMGLWLNGSLVRSATRTYTLDWGSGNPQLGDANHAEPNQAQVRDPGSYTGGDWGTDNVIDSTGILIANFVTDNPSGGASDASAGNGDTFHTDYYDEHVAASDTPLDGGPAVGTYTSTGADANTEYHEVLNGGAAAGAYTSTGADATTSKTSINTESFDGVNAFDSSVFDLDDWAMTSASDTPLTGGPGVGTYTSTGIDANTEVHQVTSGGVGTYALTGADANTERGLISAAGTDSYLLTGVDANTEYHPVTTAGVGSYSLNGADANTEVNEISGAGVGTYTSAGVDVGSAKATVTSAAVGTYSLSGVDVSIIIDEVMTAGAGSYSYTGIDAGTSKATVTTSGVGTYSLSGIDVTFLIDELTTAGTGSYALSGIDANTERALLSAAGTSSYTYSGIDAGTGVATVAATGAYTYAGAEATTTAATGISFDFIAFDERNAFDSGAFLIETEAVATAGTGSYASTGADVSFTITLSAGVGSYALTGVDAGTATAGVITAGAGSYTYSGVAATTDVIGGLAAEVGTYALTGADVTTTTANQLAAGVGSYTLTGIAANTEKAYIFTAGVGTYTYNGANVTTPFLSAEVGTYTLLGKSIATTTVSNISFDNQAFANEAFDAANAWSMNIAGDITTDAGVGAYTSTGANATTNRSGDTTTMGASFGSYGLTGTAVDLWPQVGWTAFPFTVNWANFDTDSPFYGVPGLSGLVAGDICVFENTTTPDSHAVVMDGLGEFTVTGTVTQTNTFDYFFYDNSDGNAGTTETITILGTTIVTAGVGTYALTGADANTEAALILDGGVGTYTSTGVDAAFTIGGDELIDAGVGTYSSSGTDVTFTFQDLGAEPGSYTSTGQDVQTQESFLSPADAGSYTYTGEDATLSQTGNVTLAAGTGSYSCSGSNVTTITSVSKPESPSGGYEFWDDFERELERRKRKREERRKAKEKAKRIADELTRKLALAERALEEEIARKAELARINKLVSDNRPAIEQMGNERLEFVMREALEQQTFSKMERLERELTQMRDEEMFLLVATQILVNQ